MPRLKKARSLVAERFLNTSYKDVQDRLSKGLSPLDVDGICQGSNKKLSLDDQSLMMKHFIRLLHEYAAANGLDDENASED